MTYDQIVQDKIGDIYTQMPAATKDAIIGRFISGAENWVTGYTGEASGGSLVFENVVTDRAAWRTVVWSAGGQADGISYKLGEFEMNEPNADSFKNMADLLHIAMVEGLVVMGKKIRYKKVND